MDEGLQDCQKTVTGCTVTQQTFFRRVYYVRSFNDHATKTHLTRRVCVFVAGKEGKMSTALYLLKRSTVLFLVPFAIYLFPTVLYVIIVLSIGKILHLFSSSYDFRCKYFFHGKSKEKIPQRNIARFYVKTRETLYSCIKLCQRKEVTHMLTKILVSSKHR